MNTIKIKSIKQKNKINIPKRLILELGLEYRKFGHIKLGLQNKEVNIGVLPNNENIVELSENIINSLNLPMNLNYHIKVDNHTIELGPYIGIYLGMKKKTGNRRLNYLNSYIKKYESINGLIVGFTIEDLDKINLKVNGWVYNPTDKIWERKNLPFPSSIIKRGYIDNKNLNYLYNIYGIKLFNYKKINKWQIHERLEQFNEINKYLPKSKLYDSHTSLVEFLNKHSNIYVKPIDGSEGVGIFNIHKIGEKINVYTRSNNKNITYNYSFDNLNSFSEKYLEENKYIMQETLNLKVNNKISDFRVGLDKSIDGEWYHNLFAVRVGGDASIVSNVASGGYIQYPSVALKEIYHLNEEQIKEKEKEIIDLGYKIAYNLDKTGVTLGRLALDIALTKELDIYLVEANNTAPNDSLMELVEDYETKDNIRNENAKYAKYLSGFNDDNIIMNAIDEQKTEDVVKRVLTLKAKKNTKEHVLSEVKKILEHNDIEYEIKTKGINIKIIFTTSDPLYTMLLKDINNHIDLNYLSKKIDLYDKPSVKNPEKRLEDYRVLLKKHKDLQNKSKTLMKEKNELKKLNEQLIYEKSEYKETINNLRSSKSFRITAPLRKIVKLLK